MHSTIASWPASSRSGDRGLTQAQLAQRLGRSTSFVFRYEAGARYLDIAEFIVIARALDVDPLQLLRQAEAGG